MLRLASCVQNVFLVHVLVFIHSGRVCSSCLQAHFLEDGCVLDGLSRTPGGLEISSTQFCTNSTFDLGWWRLDLQSAQQVSLIKILRRKDEGRDAEPKEIEVRVGNDSSVLENNPACSVGQQNSLNSPNFEYVRCKTAGHLVFILQDSKADLVCNIDVYGPSAENDVLSEAWARYKAADWDADHQVLRDSSNQGKDSVSAQGTVVPVAGAFGRLTTLMGDHDTSIEFPQNSIPPNFTICSLTKYLHCPREGGQFGAVLGAVEDNWVHGHWAGIRGASIFDTWLSQPGSQGPDRPSATEWLVMCGKNSGSAEAFLVDGLWVVATGNASWEGGKQLTINGGAAQRLGQTSRWAMAEIVVWDRHLSSTEMLVASDYLHALFSGDEEYAQRMPGARQCNAEQGGVCWGWWEGVRLNWCDAEAFCQAWGGHLATIIGDEDDAITDRFWSGYQRNQGFPPFIGLYRLDQASRQSFDDWRWSSGSLTQYKKWASPAHMARKYDCGALSAPGRYGVKEFYNQQCGQQHAFICNTRSTQDPDPACRDQRHGMCWRVLEEEASWEAAKAACSSMGMHLATVESLADNEVLFELAKSYASKPLWFGLRGAASAPDGWGWTSGSNATFRKWDDGFPYAAGDSTQCAVSWLAGGRYRWRHAPCESLHAFACARRTAPAPPAPILAPARTCEEFGGEEAGGAPGRCIFVLSEAASWEESERQCEGKGGHLVSVGSAEDNAVVMRVAGGQSVWIGSSDRSAEGSFTWTDGRQSNWSHWTDGQPDNGEDADMEQGPGNQDCVALGAEATWSDEACADSRAGACAVQTSCSWVELGSSTIDVKKATAASEAIVPAKHHYGTYSRFKVVHDGGYLALGASPADTWWSSKWECGYNGVKSEDGKGCPGYSSEHVPIELMLDRVDDEVSMNDNLNLIAYGQRQLLGKTYGDWVVSAEEWDLDMLGFCYFADAQDDTVATTMHVPAEEGGTVSDVMCDDFPAVVVLDHTSRIWADYPTSRRKYPYAQERRGAVQYTLLGCQLMAQGACSPSEAVTGFRLLDVAAADCRLAVRCDEPQQLTLLEPCAAGGITSLDLSDHWIQGLAPGAFAGMGGLVELDLSDNELISLPPSAFSGAPQLRVLRLESAMLESISAEAFAGLDRLEELFLNDNLIGRLEPGCFANMAALKTLDLRNNLLRTIEPHTFAGNGALARLDLSFNLLQSIQPSAFAGLGALHSLDLQYNQLDDISNASWAGLAGLRSLSLFGNHLKSLDGGVFAALEELSELNLGRNDLTVLSALSFTGLEGLHDLDLCCSKIDKIEPGAFEGLLQLLRMDLSENAVASLPAGCFVGLGALEALVLNDNIMAAIQENAFTGLSSLKSLRIVSSAVETILPGAFRGLSALEFLEIGNNPLRQIEPGAFDGLSSLQELRLWGGAPLVFSRGMFRGLSGIAVLDFRWNPIHTLEHKAFEGAETARELRLLDGGALQTLHAGCFLGLGHVTALDLRMNAISRIEPGVLEGLDSLRELYFTAGNPLDCAPFLPTHLAAFVLAFDQGYAATMHQKGVCLPYGCPRSVPYDHVPGFSLALTDGVDRARSMLRATWLVMGLMRADAARAFDEANSMHSLYVVRSAENKRCWCIGVLECFDDLPAFRSAPSASSAASGVAADPQTPLGPNGYGTQGSAGASAVGAPESTYTVPSGSAEEQQHQQSTPLRTLLLASLGAALALILLAAVVASAAVGAARRNQHLERHMESGGVPGPGKPGTEAQATVSPQTDEMMPLDSEAERGRASSGTASAHPWHVREVRQLWVSGSLARHWHAGMGLGSSRALDYNVLGRQRSSGELE